MKNKKHTKPKHGEPDLQIRAATQGEPDLQIRAATLDVSGEGDARTVSMSVSSEAPVLTWIRYDGDYQHAYEILDHSEGSIDMSRCAGGLVVLDRHYGDQVALIKSPKAGGKRFGGEVEFCTGARAQEIAADAAKGLRRNVSVGYLTDPASYRYEGEKDGIPVVRAMRWTPYEASFEPVPADVTVGVGRKLETAPGESGATERKAKMSEKPEVKLDADSVVEIYRLARSFNVPHGEADEHIKSGKSVEDFRAVALKKAEADRAQMEKEIAEGKRKATIPSAPGAKVVLDSSEQREVARRFNLFRVIRSLTGVSKEDIGFERELSDEISRRSGRSAQGIIIPHSAPIGLRADPFLKGSNGSAFVQTDLLVGQFIDALRTKMVLAKAGVTTLSGLIGDVAIPKGAAITGGWVDGENGTGTEGKPSVSQVTGTPKTASGWTDISRKLLLQSGVDVEMFVQNELIQTLARLIEVAALHGTNANGQPKGLVLQDNVNDVTVTTGAPTRAEAIEFITDIMADNAEFDGQSWIMRANGMGLLANTISGQVVIRNVKDDDNVGGGPLPEFLLDLKTRSMLGYPVHVTQNVADKYVFFGAWAQLVIGLWSGVDLTVDPYSSSTTGAVRVVALQDCDVMCRNGQAFAFCDELNA
jgi:HK97 family phage major capsid protein